MVFPVTPVLCVESEWISLFTVLLTFDVSSVDLSSHATSLPPIYHSKNKVHIPVCRACGRVCSICALQTCVCVCSRMHSAICMYQRDAFAVAAYSEREE